MNIRPKILLVDDKWENLVALEVVLKDLEVDLIKTTNGNDALRETLHHTFALALLDIQMPEMDGYELAGILREEEKTANLPFIFISAVYTDNLNIFKGYEKGAFSFITKPFHPEILINKVKFFIEKHQQEITLFRLNEDLKGKNNDLELVNRELESFTYSVSHDLRAPIRAMTGFAEILKEDYEPVLDEEGQRLLSNISVSAKKMSNLIDSLLDLSRMGKKEIKKKEIDMNKLFREIFEELGGEAKNEKFTLTIQDLPNVQGDFELLKRVGTNLLSNAIKYSARKEKPVITVGVEVHENEFVFFVEDNGAGFNMEYKNKLFGIFQRLHQVDEFEGTGIGLAIVQRIVIRSGGRVWAKGEVDKGATFYFSLPK
ncbi:MAG TPA: ATP-binding protein [Bacteroidia bacterium]|nr:ATP-binding protein [Bacteroidia bacterium]